MELNGYQIRSVMGEGGMGKVYLAVHPLVGARAAIKVMLPQFADDQEQAERFVREARVLAQLNHDRIMKIMGFGNLPDGRLYMVTEHLEGASLARIVEREAPMPPAKALALVDQILDALAAAHAAGVVHRDLKPHNVIVKTAGTERKVKLLDFGLARSRTLPAQCDPSMPLNRQTQVAGTPEYMAPEQARGVSPTPPSDLYSVGVMLFEMLTKRLPFLATNAWDMMKAHVGTAPPRVGVLIPSLPQGLEDLVSQLLSKAPEDRGAPAERVRKVVHNLLRELDEASKAAATGSGEFPRIQRPPPGEGSNPAARVPQELRSNAISGEQRALRNNPNTGEHRALRVTSTGEHRAVRPPTDPGRPASAPPAESGALPASSPVAPRVDPSYAAAREKAMPQTVQSSSVGRAVTLVVAMAAAAGAGITVDRYVSGRSSAPAAAVPTPSPPAAQPQAAVAPKPQAQPVELAAAPTDAAVAPAAPPEQAVAPPAPEGEPQPPAQRIDKQAKRDPAQLCKDVPQWRTDLRSNVRSLMLLYKTANPEASKEKGPLAELDVLREMAGSVVDSAGCVGVQRAVDRWEAANLAR